MAMGGASAPITFRLYFAILATELSSMTKLEALDFKTVRSARGYVGSGVRVLQFWTAFFAH